MSTADDTSGARAPIDPPRRDGGLVTHVNAKDRWDASVKGRLPEEQAVVRRRFRRLGQRPEPTPSHRGPVETPGSTGICCSGGGIRSAAYNLGALQAMQSEQRLQNADYLAAVSGGSYIAAAFCMVGRTSTYPKSDESDPQLIDEHPPFAPGTPEEQYLRNRSSYMAPDAMAKAYLGLRLFMGLAFNLLFIALPIVSVAILAGVWFYMPFFGGLQNGLSPTPLAIALPSVVAVASIIVGGAGMLVRPPADDGRRWSETWAVRLLMGAALIAVVTLVLPALVDAVQTGGSSPPEDTAPKTGLAEKTGGAGIAGLVAGLLASLRHALATPRNAITAARGARGWAMKLNSTMRKLLMSAAAVIAGPMLLLTIAVAALTLTARQVPAHDLAGLWLSLAALGLLLLFLCIYHWADLTTWSLHPFYKRRLSTAFALKRVRAQDGGPPQRPISDRYPGGVAVERKFDQHLPLSKTACKSGPTLVVCAAANISDPGATPAGRRVTSFTFSAESIGGPLVGALPTSTFENAFGKKRERDFTLPAAVAMSGAALAPSMGKSTNRSLRFLMTLANIRLGVWVPNPRWVAGTAQAKKERERYRRPRPGYLFAELIGRNRVDARYLYVTDGGHYENLGLVELLRRGCTNVYCFDASGGETFAELGDAIALARSELGVEVEIDPTQLTPEGDPPTATVAVVTGTIRYSTGETGRLVYARNVVSPGAPWDVRAHQRKDSRFPHDPTSDQLYTDQKFESYRVLGEHAGHDAIKAMDRLPARRAPSNGHHSSGNGTAMPRAHVVLS